MSILKDYAPHVGPSYTPLAPGQAASTQLITAGNQVTALTATQIKALSVTPIAVTPVPGAGKAVVIDYIIVELVLTSTVFANGGVLQFQYHGQTTEVMSAQIAAASVNATAGTYIFALEPAETAGGSVVTSAVAVEITNETAPFITGTGTAKIFCRYRIITL